MAVALVSTVDVAADSPDDPKCEWRTLLGTLAVPRTLLLAARCHDANSSDTWTPRGMLAALGLGAFRLLAASLTIPLHSERTHNTVQRRGFEKWPALPATRAAPPKRLGLLSTCRMPPP